MSQAALGSQAAPSGGRLANTGNGVQLVPIDIEHEHYCALIDPDTAFWALVRKEELAEVLAEERFLTAYQAQAEEFRQEMDTLRFGLGLSAVYLNPTERCNLNCRYCYIPEDMRRQGRQMSRQELFRALEILQSYFARTLPAGNKPQVVFHGAEPLLCREEVFAAIEHFGEHFQFGVQTNATRLDAEAARFLRRQGVGVGLSLDAPQAEMARRTRRTWGGEGVWEQTLAALEHLRGYANLSVICTLTRENLAGLPALVELLHGYEVPVALLNPLRCTQPPSRPLRPEDGELFAAFREALEHSQRLFRHSGRKLVVANFANVLVAILAPAARRLMCDISPCGGGRVFFALGPDGGMYPCSEFIGLPAFCGGNLFQDPIDQVLQSEPFQKVTGRKVEDITPCRRCAIRHFCGAPCPAEALQMRGGLDRPGAFCEFYEHQVRLAFRLVAEGRAEDFLWDDWARDTEVSFEAASVL